LIGTTPEGTLFQLSFCLLLYNLIQVVRGYVASANRRATAQVSAELLFYDVRRQLVALHELVEPPAVVALIEPAATAAALVTHLRRLLGGVWTDRWLKAPKKRKPPPPKSSGRREHTSVFRLLTAQRQRK